MRAWPPRRRAPCKFGDLFADALLDLGIADIGENFRDPGADLLHLGFAHAAGGDGRAAQADSAAFHWGQRIERNGILVYGDAGAVEGFFGVRSGDAAGVDFDQKQMVVRAAGDDAESLLGNGGGHSLGVGHNLLLIFLKGRFHGFFQADSFCGDRMYQRTALRAGEG